MLARREQILSVRTSASERLNGYLSNRRRKNCTLGNKVRTPHAPVPHAPIPLGRPATQLVRWSSYWVVLIEKLPGLNTPKFVVQGIFMHNHDVIQLVLGRKTSIEICTGYCLMFGWTRLRSNSRVRFTIGEIIHFRP